MISSKKLSVQAACDEVEAGMLSGYAAAKKYGVAESSISRALKRGASECPLCGRPHYAAKTIM